MTDGLFLECFREVSREFPEVQTEEILIDAFAALLVRQPEVYDVVVTTNFMVTPCRIWLPSYRVAWSRRIN